MDTGFFAHQERPMSIPKEVETHASDARRQRDREVKVGSEDERKWVWMLMLIWFVVSNILFSSLPGEMIQFDYVIFFKWVETTNQLFLPMFFARRYQK